MNKLILIDGNSLLFRAYFAMRPMVTSKGIHTQGVFAFVNMLGKILNDYEPTHIAVAFDLKGGTFRHDVYKEYKAGRPLHGVVLNDIGTIHQEGIGMPVNGEAAIYWFKEAYKQGDTLYAPTNLGDLYRKGCGKVAPDLTKAFKAYQLSIDPYAHYRIGQAYEEGWMSPPDLEKAMKWYKQASEEGHHLAIKRMNK